MNVIVMRHINLKRKKDKMNKYCTQRRGGHDTHTKSHVTSFISLILHSIYFFLFVVILIRVLLSKCTRHVLCIHSAAKSFQTI